jgi:hypothetical protein
MICRFPHLWAKEMSLCLGAFTSDVRGHIEETKKEEHGDDARSCSSGADGRDTEEREFRIVCTFPFPVVAVVLLRCESE